MEEKIMFKVRKIICFALCLVLVMAISVHAFAYNAGTATTTTPWYGICTGDGVRIRESTSTSSTILGQIDSNKPIEIVGVPSSSWYKVRYDESGNTGYIYSQYLTVTQTTYGSVLAISGVDMKTTKGGSTTVTHVPFGKYMPYRELSSYGSCTWVDCVFGMTKGWVNAGDSESYNFKYKDLA